MTITLAVDNTKKPMTTIRRAEDGDVADVYMLLVDEMYPETGIVPLDRAKATAYILETFAKGYVFVAEDKGEIIGSIGLMVGDPFWYSAQRALYDRWTFVKKGHRGKAFDLLIRAAHDMAQNGSIPYVTAVQTVNETDRKNQLFRRRGMTPIGEVFVKGLDLCVSETCSAEAVAAVAADPTPKL